MVGNSLYWIILGSQLHILEFDLGSQNIAVIKVQLPSDVYANHHDLYLSSLAKDGGLSLIIMLDNLTAQMWERMADSDGVAQWVLRRTIDAPNSSPSESLPILGGAMTSTFSPEAPPFGLRPIASRSVEA